MLCEAGAQAAALALCMAGAQQTWPEHARPVSAAGLTPQPGRCPLQRATQRLRQLITKHLRAGGWGTVESVIQQIKS